MPFAETQRAVLNGVGADMDREPKYQTIVVWVKDNIRSGKLKEGDRLPSENELCKKFSLSRQTVRHALEILESEHVVDKVQGSGTYIGDGGREKERPVYKNIAVISTYFDYYIFPPTLHGIESVLSEAGYSTRLSFTNDSVHHEKTILQMILDRDDVDGVIVEPAKSAMPNPNLNLYRTLISRRIPILFFNAYYQELDQPCVRLDDESIAEKATEVLINAGHKSIAAILNAEDGQGRLRYKGYLKAMWKHHLRTDARRTILLDSDMIGDLHMTQDYLFRCLKGVTGVMCYNDELAARLLDLLEEKGIRVPEDISVVGIDDANIAQIKGFTSFPHPKEALGRKATESLLKMIEDPSYDANYLFDASAVLRESVKII